MRRSKAFTLIELLVVIAIIAILMGVLLPALRRVKMSSKAVVCQAHLGTWAKAFVMYTNDNDSFFPSRLQVTAGGFYGQWTLALKPYYGEETKMWFCPMATKSYNNGARQPFAAWEVDSNRSGHFDPGEYGSYGINAWVYNLAKDVSRGKMFNHKYAWKSTSAATPGSVPVFGDCMWRGGLPEDDDTPQTVEEDRLINDAESMRYFNLSRHQGATNLIFLDFSARKVPLKQLWRLKWNRNFNTSKPFPVWPDWMASMSEG